jgi:hypothetical protein
MTPDPTHDQHPAGERGGDSIASVSAMFEEDARESLESKITLSVAAHR